MPVLKIFSADLGGGFIDTDGTSCNGSIDFCSPDLSNIIFENNLVRVLLKPKYGGSVGNADNPTDILIVSKQHFNNTHSLSSVNEEHRALLDEIARIADRLAYYLAGKQVYRLETNNGCNQGVLHLHVHFKSQTVLDVDAVRAMSGPITQTPVVTVVQQDATQYPPQLAKPIHISPWLVGTLATALALGVAGFGYYLFRLYSKR